MKSIPLVFLFSLTTAVAAPAFRIIDPALQARLGYDSNPIASGGGSAAVWGKRSADTWGGSVTLGVETVPTGPESASLAIGYVADASRYEGDSTENFSSHKLSCRAAMVEGAWSLSADVSELFVAGPSSTFTSTGAANANAIALWRERRAQWQHRAKLKAQYGEGRGILRVTGSLLDYDYHTAVVPGKIAFADRSDAQGGVEGGWRASKSSLWLLGFRVGKQDQAIIPLPNCGFDYDNTYLRGALSWEGSVGKRTTCSLSGGPDFRRYTGAIDLSAFGPDRNRTTLWYEVAVSSKVSRQLTVTGKATRMAWLSSTGKSAYTDTCAEVNAVYAISSSVAVRAIAKYHDCNYFPALRDDVESFYGLGATYRWTNRLSFTLDITRHHGWNNIRSAPDRAFQRSLVSLGCSYTL